MSVKIKPSDIAVNTKKLHYIEQALGHVYHSTFHSDSSLLPIPAREVGRKPRVAIENGDPVDVAIELAQDELLQSPLVNMANEKCPGGDWEVYVMAPEECLARRSNLVPHLKSCNPFLLPIPQTGGIYSHNVYIYRAGPDQDYNYYETYQTLPIISVSPISRPKLDESNMHYSFDLERKLMMEKLRTILRIAAYWGHGNLCMGAFGVGDRFRNPPREIASMWRTILFSEPEFLGLFRNIIFAIDDQTTREVFLEEFSPDKVFPTRYR